MTNSMLEKNIFTMDWMERLKNKLNSDACYAQIAKNWEGDLCINVEKGGPLLHPLILYFDLWHGTCRKVDVPPVMGELKPVFLMNASYENIIKIVNGDLNPMQAMMTRRLQVKGSMAYMMRNVPTVLDFVRCAREITADQTI